MDAKKLVLVVLVLFLGFWLFNDPNGLADSTTSAAQSLAGLTAQVFRALISFIGSF